MSIIAKFEEKTYENYFNSEIRDSGVFFSFGQVQEGFLGSDATVYSNDDNLWRILGYPFNRYFQSFPGVDLQVIATRMQNIIGSVISALPNMKINLLFQYKRPEYLTTGSNPARTHWRRQPYYQYEIDTNQQSLLVKIHSIFGTNVLVLYAAPAIYEMDDLYNKFIAHQIIECSNFKRAIDINGHHKNTYIRGVSHSYACSDPEIIKNLDLIKEFKIVDRNEGKSEFKNNAEFIISFSKQILSLTYENDYYSPLFKKLNESIEVFKEHELLYSFLAMVNFRQLTETQWLVKYRGVN